MSLDAAERPGATPWRARPLPRGLAVVALRAGMPVEFFEAAVVVDRDPATFEPAPPTWLLR